MNTKKLSIAAILIAMGTITGHLVYIPIGVAKAFPMQHTINIISAVLLGPAYAVSNAFIISLLRNILGVGSLLAFPGSLIGAFVAAILYKKYANYLAAVVGEIFGTGIIGGLLAFPLAKLLMGQDAGALFFIAPFLLSSAGGGVIAYFLLKVEPIKERLEGVSKC